jgi:type II secretory pathway component GspD/PulD (secretin)
MKNLWVLLVGILTFGVGVAQTTLPEDDPRFDTPVSIRTGPAGQPLEVLLESLARSVGLVPVFRGIPEEITVRLDVPEIPFRQAWDLLIDTYGQGLVGYRLLPNEIVLVTGGEDIGFRTYRLSYGNARDVADSLQTVIAGQRVISQTGVVGEGAAPAAQGAPGGEAAPGLNGAIGTIVTEEIQAQRPEFFIEADPRTNSLIAVGTPAQLDLVDRLLPSLDRRERQANIQVRVLDVSRTVSRGFGVNWQAAGPGGLTQLIFGGQPLSAIFDSTASLSSFNFVATLNALESQDIIDTLNDSNLTLVNNQKSTIEVVTDRGFAFVPEGDGDPITTEDTAGVIITLTPQIADNDQLLLTVDAESSEFSDNVDPSLGQYSGKIRNQTRGVVSLSDGETIVLGGLIRNVRTSNTSKTPLLGDLPLIGSLFSSDNVENEDREVLFVITANILPD